MAAPVFTGDIYNSLKDTLDSIIDDETDDADRVMPKFCEQDDMSDHYEDDLEMGGPALASEKPEGTEISVGAMREGVLTRYFARTFALRIIVTEEAMEDKKYDQVINAGARLTLSMKQTQDFDATNMLVRATNTAYTGGDLQPLASASHTLPHGGTFSNLLPVGYAPSRAAVVAATSQIAQFPGHNGLPMGNLVPKKVVFPVAQWAVWSEILKSPRAPEAGEFNAINVVNSDLSITPVRNVYWNTTTTNWCLLTNAKKGLRFRHRKRPESRTWTENSHTVMHHAIRARWARGWSEPRGILFVNA
jgi:hypothetical protein